MKKHIPSFLAGIGAALVLCACLTTALAVSGTVSYNFANVALDGTRKITAGENITAANGQKVPGSILYTDPAGGKTNYLPIRAISELLEVEISYDSATKTVLLGKQSAQPSGDDGKAIDLRIPAAVPENPRKGNEELIKLRGGTILPDNDPQSYRGAAKMFKDKDGTLRFEYLVGNLDALYSLDKKVAEKHLSSNGDYPKNSKGESYGPEQLADYVGYNPELLYVPEEGDHPAGYYRPSERSAASAKFTDRSKEECPHTADIPLYDSEGNVIGTYKIGCNGHFYTPGMTLEEVQAAVERGEW